VEIMTVPGVQIMLAAARDHGPIVTANPSPAFLGAFDDLGIGRFGVLVEDTADDASDFAQDMAASAEPPAPEPVASPDLQPLTTEVAMTRRIMTIDDSKTMRDMLMLTLIEAGFDVLQAVDGEDGIEKLAGEEVDVVITDINMPKMDGYEVIRRLRQDPKFDRTPILVLTTESEAEKRDIARKAGATGWLVKPFDPERLVETVRKVMP
jgi:two-component system, chemotaxis family, chemotaxis protein CheY